MNLQMISVHSCAYHPPAFGKGQTKFLECSSPKIGRYVYVTLITTEYLTLCEVEVYAVKGKFCNFWLPWDA